MATSASAAEFDDVDPLNVARLGEQERTVLAALRDFDGKVVSRHELARRCGLGDLSERRCDSLLVGIRRQLPTGAIRTVRSRGWMLNPWALDIVDQLLRRPSA